MWRPKSRVHVIIGAPEASNIEEEVEYLRDRLSAEGAIASVVWLDKASFSPREFEKDCENATHLLLLLVKKTRDREKEMVRIASRIAFTEGMKVFALCSSIGIVRRNKDLIASGVSLIGTRCFKKELVENGVLGRRALYRAIPDDPARA